MEVSTPPPPRSSQVQCGDWRKMSAEEENKQLLQVLKDTVEGLLISQLSNVLNVYGGLNRLHSAIEKIFSSGCKHFNQNGEPDFWVFIQGLSWLQPSLAVSPTLTSKEFDECLPQLGVPPSIIGRASTWLYQSLESHSLSNKLSWLLSDREHLTSCYRKKSFLCQQQYGEAMLICLKSVEQNHSGLLAEIDPSLFVTKWNQKPFLRVHRRCSSLPETQYTTLDFKRKKLLENKLSEDGLSSMLLSNDSTSDDVFECQELNGVQYSNKKSVEIELEKNDCSRFTPRKFVLNRLCKSLPNVFQEHETEDFLKRSCSLSSQISNHCTTEFLKSHKTLVDTKSLENTVSPSLFKIDYKKLQADTSMSEHGSDHKQTPCWRPKTFIKSNSKASRKLQLSSSGHNTSTRNSNVLVKSPVKEINPVSASEAKRNHFDGIFSNSGSSDTLNYEIESRSSGGSENVNSVQSGIRPSELNLSAKTWEHIDAGQTTELWSTENKRRKPRTVGSAPEFDSPLKTYARKSFIEDGGSSVLPMSMGFFPKPAQGQSLTSFLTSGQFSRPSAEMDRENAHFSISEAMIAAIEQVKCNRHLRLAEESGGVGDESDEEINHLKQRIRLRRRQRQREKQRHIFGVSLLSDGKTDTTTTDQSVTPTSSSPGSSSESLSTDDVDDLEVDEVKNLSQLKNSGLSMSMASLYSEADLMKHPPSRAGTDPLTESIVSAEGVALSLLRQFKEKQLPRASDLQWLVSEQDAPQELLPLPKSWPVSPDEAEDSDMSQATPLRGTVEWAPPRPQIIFTLHPSPVRRVLMAKQNSRCAGCGMKVEAQHAHTFRYCEYLGRYFCTGCHANQLAMIPGRILFKWDFQRCPVSSFSYRLLDQMTGDPLFRIGDLNAGLYRKAKQLERCRQLRLQLFYLKDFVISCRFATDFQERLKQESDYMFSELDVYSMQDLVQVRSGELATILRELVVGACQHVSACSLCQARGFVCELCTLHEVIYPWQLGKVYRCAHCGACFHTGCWRLGPCPRCIRLNTRRLSRTTLPSSS